LADIGLDLADVLVDRVRLGQGLIERVAPDHGAQRGLRDLVDCRLDVLDRHDRRRVNDLVVGDGGDVDADVVLRDDSLRLDRQRDDPQRDAADRATPTSTITTTAPST
jgi:hypothetical protein